MTLVQNRNTHLFIMLLACIMVTAVAVVAALFIAGQRPTVVVVPEREAAAPRPVAAEPAPAAASEPRPEVPEIVEQPEIVVSRLPTAPSLDPFDPAWDGAAASLEVELQPQTTAEPMLQQATIQTVQVQAAHDGERIVWRLSWEDPEPNYEVDVGIQSDAVALQFPMEPNAPFTMGGPEMPVRILYWRALWQMDVDEGFQDVHHRYPSAWSDLYWFATGEPPYALPEAFQDERSHEWLIPYSAGNPMADFLRDRPVEELTAEGFGSTTSLPQTSSNARGSWRDGRWTVVIDRPLDVSDSLSQRLIDGQVQSISLAVWDGEAGNAGGRKHWCPWIPFRLENPE